MSWLKNVIQKGRFVSYILLLSGSPNPALSLSMLISRNPWEFLVEPWGSVEHSLGNAVLEYTCIIHVNLSPTFINGCWRNFRYYKIKWTLKMNRSEKFVLFNDQNSFSKFLLYYLSSVEFSIILCRSAPFHLCIIACTLYDHYCKFFYNFLFFSCIMYCLPVYFDDVQFKKFFWNLYGNVLETVMWPKLAVIHS